MKKVLIVGAGGIGSWLCFFIHNLNEFHQFSNCSFTIADYDTVDLKNLKYQNFNKTDLTDYKAEVLGLRYKMDILVKKIEKEEELAKYDCIVSAVDGTAFRKLLFKFVYKEENKNIYWIDLRSEGRTIAFYTKHPQNNLEKMLNTLPENDKENGSCQLEFELENNIIQNGNKIVAAIGSQLLLNWYRNEFNPPQFSMRF